MSRNSGTATSKPRWQPWPISASKPERGANTPSFRGGTCACARHRPPVITRAPVAPAPRPNSRRLRRSAMSVSRNSVLKVALANRPGRIGSPRAISLPSFSRLYNSTSGGRASVSGRHDGYVDCRDRREPPRAMTLASRSRGPSCRSQYGLPRHLCATAPKQLSGVRILGIRIEELLAIDLVSANRVLTLGGDEPIDELLTKVLPDVWMFGWIYQNHAVLIE